MVSVRGDSSLDEVDSSYAVVTCNQTDKKKSDRNQNPLAPTRMTPYGSYLNAARFVYAGALVLSTWHVILFVHRMLLDFGRGFVSRARKLNLNSIYELFNPNPNRNVIRSSQNDHGAPITESLFLSNPSPESVKSFTHLKYPLRFHFFRADEFG